MKTKDISLFALYTALAFIFSYVEALLPLPFPIPGIKLGLANIVLIIILYKKGFPYAMSISVIRATLTALTFGNLFMFFFSIMGTILSLCGMALAKRATRLSIVSISALGGVLHNTGQILTAIGILGSISILSYLPILYFTGLTTGILMGILAHECLKRLPERLY